MKHIIYGLAASIMILLVVLGVLTVEGRTAREQKLKDSVQQAAASTLYSIYQEKNVNMESQDILVDEFTKRLRQLLHSDTSGQQDAPVEFQVKVAGVDAQHGLLSVHVTETFTHPNGRKGTASCDTTAVIEQPKDTPCYTISYRYPNRLYKEYTLLEGMSWKQPANPSVKGQAFQYWVDDATGEKASFPETVTENKGYTAVFRKTGEAP